jgi:mitochondrial chaperone BCS1
VAHHRVSLSGLLNVINGVGSLEGRVLIMSINYIDHLDEVLIRLDRVDKMIVFKYADKKIAAQLFYTIFKQLTTGQEQLGKEAKDTAIIILAEEFAACVLEGEFSPAKILLFLLEYKYSPADAVDRVQEWVIKQKEGKEAVSILERENSWIEDN